MKSAQEAAALGDEMKLSADLVDILKNVPEDQPIVIGGKLYTGYKEIKPDVYQFNKEDDAGNVSVVTYNNKTGEMTVKSAGNIGTKTKTSGGDSASTKLSIEDKAAIALEAENIRGIDDGYLDTGKYPQVRADIARELGDEGLKYFDEVYSPEYSLNPNDPTARKYFTTGSSLVGSADDTPLPIEEEGNQ